MVKQKFGLKSIDPLASDLSNHTTTAFANSTDTANFTGYLVTTTSTFAGSVIIMIPASSSASSAINSSSTSQTPLWIIAFEKN